MENASKALIIAGAILITVLLISLTMYSAQIISNYTKHTKVQSYSNQVDAFNRFFVYSNNDIDNSIDGIQIKGSDAYNIISKAIDINNDEWSLQEIEILLNTVIIDDSVDESNFISTITTEEGIKRVDNQIYTYIYSFNTSTGFVDKIIITNY